MRSALQLTQKFVLGDTLRSQDVMCNGEHLPSSAGHEDCVSCGTSTAENLPRRFGENSGFFMEEILVCRLLGAMYLSLSLT